MNPAKQVLQGIQAASDRITPENRREMIENEIRPLVKELGEMNRHFTLPSRDVVALVWSIENAE